MPAEARRRERNAATMGVQLVEHAYRPCVECGAPGGFEVFTLGWRRRYCGQHLLEGLNELRRSVRDPLPPAAA